MVAHTATIIDCAYDSAEGRHRDIPRHRLVYGDGLRRLDPADGVGRIRPHRRWRSSTGASPVQVRRWPSSPGRSAEDSLELLGVRREADDRRFLRLAVRPRRRWLGVPDQEVPCRTTVG